MKNQPTLHKVSIDSLSHDGRGVASINGKTTFIHGALPQEEVVCQITKNHRRYNEGETVEVLTSSNDRTQPYCQHAHRCGGCSLQHMTEQSQIATKQNILLEQLLHFGKVTPESILPPLSGNPWHYRRKARLGVRYVRKKDKVLVGFREKSTNYLTEIESCSVLHESVGLKISALQSLIKQLSQFDQIPQIEVSISDSETALIFRHLTPLPEKDRELLQQFAEQHLIHLYLQANSPHHLEKIWPLNSSNLMSYTTHINHRTLNMHFHPLDFIQINGEINQLMIKQALHLLNLQPEDEVLDLFCGLGNFTLPIALYAKHVIGIEGSQEMVKRAQANARANDISNVEFYAANLMEPNPAAPWINKKYHKILLDPPRTGAKEILPYIKTFTAKMICYVSCNPATLARDAGDLVHQYGYRLKQIGVVNMFPHTSHVEAIALFEK